MTSADKIAPVIAPVAPGIRKQASSWRSSLYDEPVWVSLAWIVIPMAFAGVAIFLAMR